MPFWDDVKDFVGDVVDLPGDLVEAGASLFEGGGSLVGLAVSGATLVLLGPGAAITVYPVAAGIGNALIKQRHLSGDERAFAEQIFGSRLPSNDRIIITNLVGIGGRPFTLPNISGQIVVNLGDAYDDPLHYADGSYPRPGQLLIHELAHAWQIEHSSFAPGFVCQGAWEQLQHTFGADIYNPDRGGPDWNDFTNEQQATIVDRWYGDGSLMEHRFYPYMLKVTGGPPPAAALYSASAIKGTPAVTSWAPNRLDIFALGQDLALWHMAWDGAQSRWQPWASLDGTLHSPPSVATWGPNRLDVFALGQDQALWHMAWDGAQSRWQPWASLDGTLISPPNVVAWGPNRLDVFALGQDQALWHTAWDGAQSRWQAWESLDGTLISAPSVTSWGPQRLDIFALGQDRALWHMAWDGTRWQPWESLDGTLHSPPSVVAWGPNRLDVFALGQDRALWHIAWDGSRWQPWESLDGTLA